MGLLDSRSLLAHVVHLTPEDWAVIAAAGSAVCFCPRSNAHLNVGQPDIEQAVRRRIVAGLGTDSLASNTDLDVFAESLYVLDRYPAIPPSAILRMATLGGAQALGRDHRWGSIEPGKTARFLAVRIPAGTILARLHEAVICQGAQGARSWASQPGD
jgi:cytosine/adenosine deaminase-related metal-dependent hydrolase